MDFIKESRPDRNGRSRSVVVYRDAQRASKLIRLMDLYSST
jgi:hypothetical protein